MGQNMAPLKFLKGLNFLKNLDFFFLKKSVIPINSSLNFVGQKGYLTLFLFVRMAKSVKLNRRLRIFRAKKAQESISSFYKFVFSNLKELRINALSTKVVLLNKVFFPKHKHARFFNFIKKNFTVLLENGLKFG